MSPMSVRPFHADHVPAGVAESGSVVAVEKPTSKPAIRVAFCGVYEKIGVTVIYITSRS